MSPNPPPLAQVRIVLRADSGFARDRLMAWCESRGVDFLFGLARNSRLGGEIESELAEAAELSRRTGQPARASGTSPGQRATAGAAARVGTKA